MPNGAKVVPKRAKTICANSCQNSSGPYVILLISGVSIPDRAEPRENTELDLNKTYQSFIGTYWHQFLVPEKDVPTQRNACQKLLATIFGATVYCLRANCAFAPVACGLTFFF